MFINQVVVAVIFRLINFGVVIGLAVYFFRKYALPLFYTMIAQKDAEKELLLSQQLLLEQKQAELDSLIEQDVFVCESFKLKVDEWRSFVEKERAIHAKDCLKRNEIIEVKKRKKSELLAQGHLQKIVATAVIADLHRSLINHFEKDDAASVYLDSMVQAINERVS